MAFEINDLKGFLLMVLLSLSGVASTNIDCHGKPFHCINSTHFIICVDLGGGISTTIDDFVIPCPPTTSCHATNKYECEFPKPSDPVLPLEVIGVTKYSDNSVTSSVTNSASTTTPSSDLDDFTSEVYPVTSEMPGFLKVNESMTITTTTTENINVNELNSTVDVVDKTVFSESDVTSYINHVDKEPTQGLYTTPSIRDHFNNTNDFTFITESNSDHNFIVDTTRNNTLALNYPSSVVSPPIKENNTVKVENTTTVNSYNRSDVSYSLINHDMTDTSILLSSDISSNNTQDFAATTESSASHNFTKHSTSKILPLNVPNLPTSPTSIETKNINDVNITENVLNVTFSSNQSEAIHTAANQNVNKTISVITSVIDGNVPSNHMHNLTTTVDSHLVHKLIDNITDHTKDLSSLSATQPILVKINFNDNNQTTDVVYTTPSVGIYSKDIHNFTEIKESNSNHSLIVDTTTNNYLPLHLARPEATPPNKTNYYLINTDESENTTLFNSHQSDVTYPTIDNDMDDTSILESSNISLNDTQYFDTTTESSPNPNFIEHTTYNVLLTDIPNLPTRPTITEIRHFNDLNKTENVDNVTILSLNKNEVFHATTNQNVNETTSVVTNSNSNNKKTSNLNTDEAKDTSEFSSNRSDVTYTPIYHDIIDTSLLVSSDKSSNATQELDATTESSTNRYFVEHTTNNILLSDIPTSQTSLTITETKKMYDVNNTENVVNTTIFSSNPSKVIHPAIHINNKTISVESSVSDVNISSIHMHVLTTTVGSNLEHNFIDIITTDNPLVLQSSSTTQSILVNINNKNNTEFKSNKTDIIYPIIINETSSVEYTTPNIDKFSKDIANFTNTTQSDYDINMTQTLKNNNLTTDFLSSQMAPTILENLNINFSTYFSNLNQVTNPIIYHNIKDTTAAIDTTQNTPAHNSERFSTTTKSNTNYNFVDSITSNYLQISATLLEDSYSSDVNNTEIEEKTTVFVSSQNVTNTDKNIDLKITTPIIQYQSTPLDDIQNFTATTASYSDPNLIEDGTTDILPSVIFISPLTTNGVTTEMPYLDNVKSSDAINGTQNNASHVVKTFTTNYVPEYEFNSSQSQQIKPNSSTLVGAASIYKKSTMNSDNFLNNISYAPVILSNSETMPTASTLDNSNSSIKPINITHIISSTLKSERQEFANQSKINKVDDQNKTKIFNTHNKTNVIDTDSLSIKDEHDKLLSDKLSPNQTNIETHVLSESDAILLKHIEIPTDIPDKNLDDLTVTKSDIIPQEKESILNIINNEYSAPTNNTVTGELLSINKQNNAKSIETEMSTKNSIRINDVNTDNFTHSVKVEGKSPSELDLLSTKLIKIKNTTHNATKNYTIFDNSKLQVNNSRKLEPDDKVNAATLFSQQSNITNSFASSTVANAIRSKPILNKQRTEYFDTTVSKNNSLPIENSALMRNTNNDSVQIVNETSTSLPLNARDITSNPDTVSIFDKNVISKGNQPTLATTTNIISNNNNERISLLQNNPSKTITESFSLNESVAIQSGNEYKGTTQQIPQTTVTPVFKEDSRRVPVKVIQTIPTAESIKYQTTSARSYTLQETTPLIKSTNTVAKFVSQMAMTQSKVVNNNNPRVSEAKSGKLQTTTVPDRKLESKTSTIRSVENIPQYTFVPTQITKPETLASVTQSYPTTSTIFVQKVVDTSIKPNTNNKTISLLVTTQENNTNINNNSENDVKYQQALDENTAFINNTLSSKTEQNIIVKQNTVNDTHMIVMNKSDNSFNNIRNVKQSLPKVIHDTVKNQTNIISSTILTNENNNRKTPALNKIEQNFLAEAIQVNTTNFLQLGDLVVNKNEMNVKEGGKSSSLKGPLEEGNERDSHELPETKELNGKRRTNLTLIEILSPEKVENVVQRNIYSTVVSEASALNQTKVLLLDVPRKNITVNTPNTVPLTNITTNQNNPHENKSSINKNNTRINNTNKSISIKSESVYHCPNHSRGRYADNNDCRKFYICIGNHQPITGSCPNDTVFSAINKHCTKNLSHCVRNNQFRCVREGRFSDFLDDKVYYICIKDINNHFLRYKLLCQKGHRLNRTTVKCEKIVDISSQSISSISEYPTTIRNTPKAKSQSQTTPKPQFACKKEGKFPHETACTKYYVCTKNKKGEYRQRLIKCGSEEVYNKRKEKCIESESNDC